MTAEHPIVAFLKARLDEDEQTAREALPALVSSHGTVMWPDYETFDSPALDTATAYLERFQPARVLREVEAKRKLLGNHKAGRYGECVTCDVGAQSCGCCGWGEYPCETVVLLALPYSDHTEYAALGI